MTIARSIACLMLVSNLALAQRTERDFEQADSMMNRLPASTYPQLPSQIKKALDEGGFRIPQSFDDSLPHNVISGEFSRHGQRDWAVLASRNRVSCILIFWNGSVKDTTHFRESPDINYIQDMADQGILYSRVIRAIRMDFKDCIQGSDEPSIVDHDAIEDDFLNKAYEEFYFYGGKWLNCISGD